MTEQVKQYPFNYDGEDDAEILKSELPEEVTLTAVDSGFEMSDELAERFCEPKSFIETGACGTYYDWGIENEK